jgi:hypothetical protein
MPAQDKLAEDMPAQGELVEDKPEADKPALSMLAESMPAQDELAEDMPAQGELVKDKPAADKPALSMPAQDKPAEDMPAQGQLVVDKLEEQHKRKQHQMEADSPAVNAIAYMCKIAKLRNEEGLRMGMDPLRGVFWTLEGPV